MPTKYEIRLYQLSGAKKKRKGFSSAHYGILNVFGVGVVEELATIKSSLDIFSLVPGLEKHLSAKYKGLKDLEIIYSLSY